MEKLKTLRDLEKREIKREGYYNGWFEDHHYEYNQYMSNYKRVVTKSEDLKQEVIKWIKELSKEYNSVDKPIKRYYISTDNSIIINKELITWIKHFFNITNDDLK